MIRCGNVRYRSLTLGDERSAELGSRRKGVTTIRAGKVARSAVGGRHRSGLALGTLFLGAFVVGSAELVVAGVLDVVARDLSVSVSAAGTLATAYALGISVGGPVLTALSVRLGRHFLLRLALGAYLFGSVLALVSVNYGMLLVARVVAGSVHGPFVGGWAADRGATATLVACNAVLVLALGALYVVGSAPVPVAVALGVWGLVGFGLVPSLQYRAVGLAGAGADLAATLLASKVNAGIAFGALAGAGPWRTTTYPPPSWWGR
jgi:MFS transporter, DHA1 family, inner membrane transport protein